MPRNQSQSSVGEPPTVHVRTFFKQQAEKEPVEEPLWTPQPTAVDFTQAIYDFSLAYEIAVLRSLEQYADYDLSNFFLLGRRRPVRRPHQLIVERVSYESPLHFLALIPPEVLWWTAGGVGASGLLFLGRLIDVLEKVYTVPVNFKNARLRSEVENMRLRMERDDLERKAEAQLRRRVETERFQLDRVKIESDDWPPGLA